MIDETNQTESLEFEVPEPELETLDDEDGLTGDDQAESEEAEGGEGESEEGEDETDEDSTTEDDGEEETADAPPTADKVAEWLRSQGYQVAKPEAEAEDATELWDDPEKYLARRDQQTKSAILAELDPFIRPATIAQAEQSLTDYVTRLGLELDPAVDKTVRAEIRKATTADIQGAVANPATWGNLIGNVREALGVKAKAKPKEVRASITSGVTSGGPKRQTMTLDREEAAMLADWQENVGDTPEDRKAFGDFIKSRREGKGGKKKK